MRPRLFGLETLSTESSQVGLRSLSTLASRLSVYAVVGMLGFVGLETTDQFARRTEKMFL